MSPRYGTVLVSLASFIIVVGGAVLHWVSFPDKPELTSGW
jgi:hypothetical protein